MLALAAILVFNAAFTPGFFNFFVLEGRLHGSLIDVANRAVPVLLLALGMTLVIATGGVDLSVGAVMAVSGAVAACLIARPEGSPLSSMPPVSAVPMVIGLALGVSILCGLFNGFLVSWVGLQPIVATLLLMVSGRGVAQLLTNGQIVIFERPEFQNLATGAFAGLPSPVWIAVLAIVLVSAIVRSSALGLFVEAVGSNSFAAAWSGVNVKAVKMAVYGLSGLCAGMAGLIGTADIKAADANNAGLYLELDAILAVAIGGTALTGGKFSLAGTVIAAVLLQALSTTIYTRGVPPEATLVIKAGLVVAVCVLQSTGRREKAVAVST